MAGRTLSWRRLIEKNLSPFHLSHVGMASGTANVHVDAFQLEKRTRVVVKERGFPFICIVATRAANHLTVLDELSCMRIGVASFAVVRSRLEVHVVHSDFQVLRLVTINAGNGAMRAEEFELGRRVIKFRHVSPR